MPTVRRKGLVEAVPQAEENQTDEGGIVSDIVEEVADFGLDSVLSGLVDIAASAGGAIVDVAGSVAESAVEVVADVAGSVLDGL